MAKRRCKNGRRADGKCRKTKRSGARGSTRLYSDVTKFVRATGRRACGSPERAARTARAVSYLKSLAAVEAGDGLNKSTARARIGQLKRTARLVMAGHRKCVRQAEAAAKRAAKRAGGRVSTSTALARWP